jgi:hypothetical protein
MEAVGALRCEATGELDRIAALERHRLPPASRESDGSALEDVDRRYHFEVMC